MEMEQLKIQTETLSEKKDALRRSNSAFNRTGSIRSQTSAKSKKDIHQLAAEIQQLK